MFVVFSCLHLLSCVELCIFLCCLVLFVNTLCNWLAGKIYICDIFPDEVFPLQRPESPDWKLFTVMIIIMDVFLTRNVVNFLISFTFLTATKFSKTWYSAESAISTKRVSSVSNQAYTNRSCSRRHTPSLLGHCKWKAMQDDGVVYVAGHPLLPGCIRLRNYLYCVGEAQLNSTQSLHH